MGLRYLYTHGTRCRALREDPELREVVVSVDTYYASVAREAVAAGADVVNDVSGGAMDPDMLRQVIRWDKAPSLLSHKDTTSTFGPSTALPNRLARLLTWVSPTSSCT